jgi:Proteasome complex subunit Rpn13 ubiquitin receptor
VEDDLIVMPGELEWSRVDTGRAGDRVFLLQVTGTPRRHFYWMQSKDSATVSYVYC